MIYKQKADERKSAYNKKNLNPCVQCLCKMENYYRNMLSTNYDEKMEKARYEKYGEKFNFLNNFFRRCIICSWYILIYGD